MKAVCRIFLFGCFGLVWRRRFDAEMAEEMQAHLDALVEANIAAGLSPEDARLAARKSFGGLAQIEEACRAQHRFLWLDQLWKDIVFSARSLARARSFTLHVLAMLVLGTGLATLVFTLTAWILIFSLPYPHPEQLHLIGFKDKHSSGNSYRSAMQLHAYQEQTKVFSEYAAVTRDQAYVVIDGEPVVVNLLGTSEDCFRTLGIKPALGRGFLPEEFRPGSGNVVVITDYFWRKHFQTAPDILGRTIVIDQQSCIIVGVLARGQFLPPAFGGDIYRPSRFEVDAANPLAPVVFVIGRQAAGVSQEQARTALASVKLPALPSWAVAYLGEQEPMLLEISDPQPKIYWVMAIAAVLLYGIACLNAMNLMLLRLLGRRREFSIRLALGGTRWQVARLLIIESVGLGLAASALVASAAHWLFPHIFAALANTDAIAFGSALSGYTLLCIIPVTGLACFAITLVPVCRLLRSDINPGLQDGGAAGDSPTMGRVRAGFVIAQAALAVILLAGTGLMVRSFEQLHRKNFGFEPTGRVKVVISLRKGYELKPEARLQLFERLQQRLAAIPGVREVSYGQDSLLIGQFAGTAQVLMPDGTYQSVVGAFVGADYLKTAGVSLKRGRWLSGKRGGPETVINETMAKSLFGEADPIGRTFKLLVSGDFNHNVVGVVSDVRQTVRATPGMQFYAPDWVYPTNLNTLLLRLDTDPPKEFSSLIRRAIFKEDPNLIAGQVNTVNEIIGWGMASEQYAFKILKLLTGVALVLAVVGLFSVVAYTVACRKKEYGVRLALGARPADLHRLVMRRGMAAAGAGVVLGVGGALVLTRFMQCLLFETEPYDPSVYVAVSAVLLAAAAAACWWPARKAAQADVTTLLRTDYTRRHN